MKRRGPIGSPRNGLGGLGGLARIARSGLGGLGGLDRIARVGLNAAARRWPQDLSETMRYEWSAELDAIRDDPASSRPVRAYRMVAFAGSIALSPAVEEAGAEPVTWRDRVIRPASAAGLTLLAAALFNAVHEADHRAGPGGALALAAAALLMAAIGYRCRVDAVRTTVLMGASMFAFLMAGNQVAVMPFMGWIDILPAVAVWTALTAAGAALAARRRALGILTAVAAIELAAVAGSLHAAHVLGLGFGSAPAWFPLALAPGGTADFGPYFADGTAAFGRLQGSGPAFHASEILLGNASAMVGPMLLCTMFAMASALRRAPRPPLASRPDLRVPLGVAGAVAVLIAGELMRPSGDAAGAALHRLIDNSNVFGFGFLADTPGRVAVALLGGLLAARLGETAHLRRDS